MKRYESPEELEAAIENYAEACAFAGTRVMRSGLVYALGFPSHQAFNNQARRGEDWADVIDRARLLVEMSYEEMLDRKNCTGAIFALKQMGWSDKQEIEHAGAGVSLVIKNG